MHCILCIVLYSLYYMHCIIWNVYYALFSKYYIAYYGFYTMHSILFEQLYLLWNMSHTNQPTDRLTLEFQLIWKPKLPSPKHFGIPDNWHKHVSSSKPRLTNHGIINVNFRSRQWGSSHLVCTCLTLHSTLHRHQRKFVTARLWGGQKLLKHFCKAQPKPQLAGLVLFLVNPDKRLLTCR
jgi:hypothetical protein